MPEYTVLVTALRGCANYECQCCILETDLGCRNKLIAEAADAIEELQNPTWISVKERLPYAECGDYSESVLVTDGECVAVASYFNGDDWKSGWGYTGIGNITHWQTLPELPMEG